LNINKTYLLLVFLGLLIVNVAKAQSTYQFGALPSLNINNKFQNGWSLNSKVESRQLMKSGNFNGNSNKEYKYVLTDFSFIGAKKVGLNSRIAGGYLIRLRETEIFHRLIQQYTIVQKMNGFRLAHRFSSDQTFSNGEKPEFRLRYRITSEIPLNGESVDPKEFYIKLNNEYLNSWQGTDYDFEIRLAPLLGYDITDDNKIELGLDYRVNSFLNNGTRHSFWLSLNWFIEI
jgi:hypothetical protein